MDIQKSMSEFSVIILAAGRSSRMGVPKFTLKFSENTTFLHQIVNCFNQLDYPEIKVVLNAQEYSLIDENILPLYQNVSFVKNEHPAWERFYSIKIGIENLKKRKHIFILNVDNPFVNKDVLDSLLKFKNSADLIVPTFEGKGGHPILINQKIADEILLNAQNQINFKEFLSSFEKKLVPVNEEKIRVNINTMLEFKKYFDV